MGSLQHRSVPGFGLFESLDEREQQKAQALFDLVAERPMLTNLEKFRRLRREIWELKTTNSRFTCFFDNEGRRLVVVAGFKKQRQAAPAEEIKRAEEVFAAYDP
jgi:hypothetical protein